MIGTKRKAKLTAMPVNQRLTSDLQIPEVLTAHTHNTIAIYPIVRKNLMARKERPSDHCCKDSSCADLEYMDPFFAETHPVVVKTFHPEP